jgi:hypothetical protein
MIHRRLVKSFPIFWGYTVFHVLLSLVSFVASHVSYRAYFYTYWGAEIIDMILTLLIIQELFWHVFALYEAIDSLGRILFRSATVIMIIFSVLLGNSGGGGKISPLVDKLMSLERSVHIFEIGVLFALFLGSRILGIAWQRFAFGVAVGMGLTLSGEAIAAAVRVSLGNAGNNLYTWLEPTSCALATIVWTYYSISADQQAEVTSAQPAPTQLAEWNRVLEHFLSKS